MTEIKFRPTESPSLGELDENGQIWTTSGWSNKRAWLLRSQITAAERWGWALTGRSEKFMGFDIYEVDR